MYVSLDEAGQYVIRYVPCRTGGVTEIRVLVAEQVMWDVTFNEPTAQRDFEYGIDPPGATVIHAATPLPQAGVLTFDLYAVNEPNGASDRVAFKFHELSPGHFAIGDAIKRTGDDLHTNCPTDD